MLLKAKKPDRDPKSRALQQEGSLHPHPEQVTDELFLTQEFFDARDLVQVKYEMLRRVQSEGQAVSQSAGVLSPVRLPVSPPGQGKNFHYHGIKLPQPLWRRFREACRSED